MKTEEAIILSLVLVALYLVVKSQSKTGTAKAAPITRRSDFVYDAAAIEKAQNEPLKLSSLDPITQYMRTGGAEGSW